MRRVANGLWLCPQSRHGYRLDLERLGHDFSYRKMRIDADVDLCCIAR